MTNIALIVLDTLRYDTFEEYFDWLPGRRFDNAWSTSHWTVPAHASLFTGKYASEVGVYSGRQSLDCTEAVLTEQLAEAGYKTRGFSCNINISELYSFDRGFDELVQLGHQAEKKRHTHVEELFDWSQFISESPDGVIDYVRGIKQCINSDCVTIPSIYHGINMKFDISGRVPIIGRTSDMGSRSVLNTLQERTFQSEEFLFLNLMEAHTPYVIPDEYITAEEFQLPNNPLGQSEPNYNSGPVQERYSNAVRYLSDVYKEIFEEIKEYFDIIITVSDHGELLGEHGYYEHNYGVYPELTHVPLTIWSGQQDIHHESQAVSILDIHATILDAANTEQTSYRGRSLLTGPDQETPVLTEYHGIPYPDQNLEELDNWSESETAVRTYQDWKRGIVFCSGCYGYETHEEFKREGNCQDCNPQKELSTMIEELDVMKEQGSEPDTIPQSIEEDLRNLGYIS